MEGGLEILGLAEFPAKVPTDVLDLAESLNGDFEENIEPIEKESHTNFLSTPYYAN